MGRNAKDSPWTSTPQAMRKRKQIVVTLSDEAREKLARLVKARGGVRSKVMEDMIMREPEGKR